MVTCSRYRVVELELVSLQAEFILVTTVPDLRMLAQMCKKETAEMDWAHRTGISNTVEHYVNSK